MLLETSTRGRVAGTKSSSDAAPGVPRAVQIATALRYYLTRQRSGSKVRAIFARNRPDGRFEDSACGDNRYRTARLPMSEPFGQADCESEVRSLKAEYSELYFDETPFNEAAIKPETYLIIGR